MQRYIIDPKYCSKIHNQSESIIIGSGIAGLFTALKIAENKKVTIITKKYLNDGSTWQAQGGIAGAIKKPDNWKKHYEDTLKAGHNLNDKKAVKILTKEAKKRIDELIMYGVNFDKTDNGIDLNKEGGHSMARVLHKGDTTGKEVEQKLIEAVKKNKNIKLIENFLVTDILTEKNKVIGAIGLNKNKLEIFPSNQIVIATGGIGQIFSISTNPKVSTGDGIAMAYRAKAEIKDMEFIQFHPTVFKTKTNETFLITEALRGAGAYLKNKKGERFMIGVHPLSELAPRDIVVKEIINTIKKTKCNYIYLDAKHLQQKELKTKFPNIFKTLKNNGLNLSKDLIPIFPAAHYLCGGIKTDCFGKTNIKGLYACGETARTGVHGSNRLASNSLLEGIVFGARVAETVKGIRNKEKGINMVKKNPYSLFLIPSTKIKDNLNKFRELMTKNAGVIKNVTGLKKTLEFINKNLRDTSFFDKTDKNMIEFINMLTVGKLTIEASLKRKKSIGNHQIVNC